MYPGGNAVNVAVHARRNGATSAYLGAVGTDRAGHVVLAALEEEGVDTTLTRRVDGPNAYADVRIVAGNRVFGAGGCRYLQVHRRARPTWTAAAAFDIVHTGECSMLEGQLKELAEAARTPVLRLLRAALGLRAAPTRPTSSVAIWSAARRRTGPTRRTRRAGSVTSGRRWSRSPWAPAVRCCCTRTSSPTAQWAPARSWTPSGQAMPSSRGSWSGIARSEPLQQLVGHATAYATATCATYGAFGHRTPSPARRPSSTPSATADWTSDESRNTHEHLSGGGLRGADLCRLRCAVQRARRVGHIRPT